ncbi:MAG: hypothetical protein ACM3SR_15925, partial [Ignavibacteriales bacterium]
FESVKRDNILRNKFSGSRKVQRKDFSFECVLNRIIGFIRSANCILQRYSYLRRKVEFLSEFIVEKMVECYTVKALLLPRYITNPIESLVAGIKRLLDYQLVGMGRIQFNFHSSFKHIDIIYAYRNISSTEAGNSSPSLKRGVSLPDF